MKDYKYRNDFIDPLDPEILEWLDRKLGLSRFDRSKIIPRRLEAAPDELLSYYLGRLGEGNGIAWPSLVRQLGVNVGPYLDNLDIGLDFSLLRALSQVKPTKAYFHRLLRMPFRRFPLRDSRYFLWRAGEKESSNGSPPRSWIQYCPLCLSEDEGPYFRRKWRLVSVSCCLKHSCILHDRCPVCKEPPSRRRFSLGCCGQLYAQAPVIAASTEAMALESAHDRSIQMLLVRQGSFKEDRIFDFHAAAMGWLNGSGTAVLLALSPRERHDLNARLAQAISAVVSNGKNCFDDRDLDFYSGLAFRSKFPELVDAGPESVDVQTFVRWVLRAGFRPGDVNVEDLWGRFLKNPDEVILTLRARHNEDELWNQYQRHWNKIANALGTQLPPMRGLHSRA